MNQPIFPRPNSSTNSLRPLSEHMLTPEMEADITKAVTAIGSNHHVVLSDPAHMGSSTVLKEVAERCKNQTANSPKTHAFYADCSKIHSLDEFLVMWIALNILALSADEAQLDAYAQTYLSEYEYEIIRSVGENKAFPTFVRVSILEDPMKVAEDLIQIGNKICKEQGSRLVACIDNPERLAELNESKCPNSWFYENLWLQDNLTVVTASPSKKFNDSLTGILKPNEFEKIELTVPSKKSVKEIAKVYFKKNNRTISKKELNYLGKLSGSNLGNCLELAEKATEISKGHISIKVIKDAYTSVVNSREILYRNQTARLPQVVRQAFQLQRKAKFLSPTSLVEHLQRLAEQVTIPIKDVLIEAGILIEKDSVISFADPIYQYWIKNRYDLIWLCS